MPIYEYLCQGCGFGKDVLQKLSDAPLTDCPSCGKDQYRKQISAAGFRLKGQGWYETDFKTGAKKNIAGDKASSSASSSSTASSSAGDAKTANAASD
jgi:putative FmdB family regulatory protein